MYVPTAVPEALLGECQRTSPQGGGEPAGVRAGTIKLSELYQPPTSGRIFPAADQLIAASRGWLLSAIGKLSCTKRLTRPIDETVTMCAHLFPEAEYEGNFLATIFTALQFVFDDIFDSIDVYEAFRETESGKQRADELRRIRSNPRLLGQGMMAIVDLLHSEAGVLVNPLPAELDGDLFLLEAFGDFSRRLHEFGKRSGGPAFRTWLRSFTDALIHFSRSHMEIYRAVGELSVEEYTTHKLVNCGMLHTILLLELAMGRFLSREQHELPLISAIKQHCIYVGSLLNEITSYEKEVFLERSGNLLLVVMLKTGCDLRRATEYVASLAQTHADEVVRLREQAFSLWPGADEQSTQLRSYVSGIELLSAACWQWQITGTTRYQSTTTPFAELLVKT